MTTDHTSKDFDQALERARQLVEQMGARVERQLTDALEALHSGSPSLIAQILRHEAEVNGLERAIDEYGGQIIARRHPAARDLRLVMAGAEMLRQAVQALERLDPQAAAPLVRRDLEVNAAMGADVRHATVHELERLLHR